MKFFRDNKKPLIFLLIFIVIFPFIILYPSPYGVIPRDIGIALVGYGGAIIGGFLTLYGVWWTIEDNAQSRRKELELQYCPILSAEIVPQSENIYQLASELIVLYDHPYFDDADLGYTKHLIKLCNVGRGEIQKSSIRLESCSILAVNPEWFKQELKVEHSYILGDGSFEFIPIGGAFYLYVALPKFKNEYADQLDGKTYARLEFMLQIKIDGAFSLKEQEYRLHFFLNVDLCGNVEESKFDSVTLMRVKENDR